jgi:microcystin-dependent protein
MKQTIETLKTYFETGDVPTESQYVDLIDSLAMPMIGEIKTVSFATIPNGWAKCDGQLLTIAEHQTLFNLIGTTYGGNGTTTFALPNLQGKTMIHNDTTYGLGNTGGTAENTLSESQLPAHKHDVGSMTASHNLTGTLKVNEEDAVTDEATGASFGVMQATGAPDVIPYNSLVSDTLMVSGNVQIDGTVSLSGSTTTSGNGAPVNNMPPYLAVNTIIALEGINPLANS